jgi:uncharacterized protein YhbP (UPF0306 family)
MSGRSQELEMIAALLKSQSTLSLATSDEAGVPHATPLFYFMEDDLSLYWFSSQDSAHSRNLKRSGKVAVSVYRPSEHWQEICGVQMSGVAAPVTDRQRRKAVTRLYVNRFQLGTIFRVALARSVLYCFRPRWIRYLDNSKRFGYKFEVVLEAGTAGVESKVNP